MNVWKQSDKNIRNYNWWQKWRMEDIYTMKNFMFLYSSPSITIFLEYPCPWINHTRSLCEFVAVLHTSFVSSVSVHNTYCHNIWTRSSYKIWSSHSSKDVHGGLLSCDTMLTCRWRKCVPPKHWYPPISQHGVTTQKTNMGDVLHLFLLQSYTFQDTMSFNTKMVHVYRLNYITVSLFKCYNLTSNIKIYEIKIKIYLHAILHWFHHQSVSSE
jgi:hypothetical protein